MSDRYHINPETGNPGKCSAMIKCRFGNDEPHYNSPHEARVAFEAAMETSSTNSATLEAYEANMDAYVEGSRQEVSGVLKSFIDDSFSSLPLGSNVLELGSAFGRDAEYLEGKGFNVIATDAAESFVAALEAKGFKAQKLNALLDGFPRSDAIFANAVFLHFSRDELSLVLNKAMKSLNGNGKLVFAVKEGEGEEWSSAKLGAPRHFTYWQEKPLRHKLEQAGFLDIRVTRDETGPSPWLQVAARRPRAKKANVATRHQSKELSI